MQLIDLIKRLEQEDPNKIIRKGFHNPHSYRGYYEELSFEPLENAKISEMLKCAKESLGNTYEGYKGGEFTMTEYTNCNIAFIGECAGGHDGTITPLLIDYMLADEIKETK